jgi:hypothetical protein
MRNACIISIGEAEGNSLGDRGEDWRIILKWIFKILDVKMWI